MKTPLINTELILQSERKSRLSNSGYICRALLAFFCALAFSIFTADSLRTKLTPNGTLEISKAVIVSLFAVAVFSIMGISKKTFFGIGTSGILAAIVINFGNNEIFTKIYYCVVSVQNAFFNRLTELGFKGMDRYVVNCDSGMKLLHTNEYICLDTAYTVIIILYSALFTACILKKVHMIPLIGVGSAVCTLFLYYGMPANSSGFAMIIAGLCAIIVLSGYDRTFTDKRSMIDPANQKSSSKATIIEIKHLKKQSSAIGGFVGISTALLCSLILLLPAQIQKSMPDIPAISAPAAKLENYFFSLVNGQSPDLGNLIFSGVSSVDKRSTAFSERTYYGTHVLTVNSDVNIPIYLRNWIGTDYHDDSWHSPDYSDIYEFKTKFGDDFSSELLTNNILWAFSEDFINLDDDKSYENHYNLGYVTARIDIRKARPSSNLLYFPSYTDHQIGLLRYSTYEPLDNTYQTYSDGIFSSTGYVFLNDYSVVANIPTQRDSEFVSNLSVYSDFLIYQAHILYDIIKNAGGENTTDEALEKALKNSNFNIEYIIDSNKRLKTLPFRYVYDMDTDERQRFVDLISEMSEYREYVYSTYLGGCESFDAFETLARSIVYSDMPSYQDMDKFSSINLKVRKIIDYLSENMTYTLTPKDPDPNRPYVNAAETFLFDTNEGYCVQFATSAVMLIRALGIPARYAEGYIANNFVRDQMAGDSGQYTSKVLDKNAHAWVEVYFDNYGWIQYEATTPYMSEMYDGYIPSSSSESETTTPVESQPQDTTVSPSETTSSLNPLPETPEEPIEEKTFPKEIIIAVIIAAIAASIILFFKARAVSAEKRFEKLKTSAANSNKAARELNNTLYKYLKLYDLAPHIGEQPSEFAIRANESLSAICAYNFTNIILILQRIEFAPSHSTDDIMIISEYCTSLRTHLLSDRRFCTRLWRKYILAL